MGVNYPTSLDTTTTLYTAVNNLTTTANGAQTSTATSIIVASTTGAPATGVITTPAGEAIKYTSLTGTSFGGLTRGFDGTTAAPIANNDTITVGLVADHHNILVTAILAIENKLGTGTLIAGSQLAAATITGAKIAAATVTTDLLSNQNHLRAKFNADSAAISASTFTKLVNFGTVVDQGGNFSASSRYTAPLALRYLVNATVVVKSGGTAGSFYVLIYKNGSEWSRVNGVISNTAVPTAISISDVVTLAATDYVEIYVWSPNAGMIASGTGSDVCFLSVAPQPS